MTGKDLLDSLIGAPLSAVVFVQDYIQLQFDGPTLTLLTPVSVQHGSDRFTFPAAGSRDALCSVIGKALVKHSVSANAASLEFADGAIIHVPLDNGSRRGPEAMILQSANKQRWNVW